MLKNKLNALRRLVEDGGELPPLTALVFIRFTEEIAEAMEDREDKGLALFLVDSALKTLTTVVEQYKEHCTTCGGELDILYGDVTCCPNCDGEDI